MQVSYWLICIQQAKQEATYQTIGRGGLWKGLGRKGVRRLRLVGFGRVVLDVVYGGQDLILLPQLIALAMIAMNIKSLNWNYGSNIYFF